MDLDSEEDSDEVDVKKEKYADRIIHMGTKLINITDIGKGVKLVGMGCIRGPLCPGRVRLNSEEK